MNVHMSRVYVMIDYVPDHKLGVGLYNARNVH